MSLVDLPTLADLQAAPRATPKGLPHQLVKKERAKFEAAQGEAFRRAVWIRDHGCSRATGKRVSRGGTNWAAIGEVDHSVPRSLAPERIFDVSNGLLLSKEENRLRKVACPHAPEHRMFDYSGPTDRSKPQTFIWRDVNGKIVKRRIG